MSGLDFVAYIRDNWVGKTDDSKSFKITVPRDVVSLILDDEPDIRYLRTMTVVRSNDTSFTINDPMLAKGSGWSRYILLNADTIRSNDLHVDERVSVRLVW